MDLQSLCDAGQRLLVATDYIGAETLLADAERQAWELHDWDTLSRLYMPLQEARRQKRQRCGEGVVKLDLHATTARDVLEPNGIVEHFPHGQLVVAGWGSIEPARQVRQLAKERGLYLETMLAATFPTGDQLVIAIVPTEHVALPPVDGRPIDALIRSLPPHTVVLPASGLVPGERVGDDVTYAETMALWEKLHAPFLAVAEHTTEPVRRMIEYRRVIEVDYACEIAHQNLSKCAHALRGRRL
ncbi:MAG: hypothetical protein QM770_03425 [Tepidisphaeraceae bacterium]